MPELPDPTPGNYCPTCGQDSCDHRVSIRLLTSAYNIVFLFFVAVMLGSSAALLE